MNGDWLLRGRDGRLSVYVPSDDALLCRAELHPHGPWEAAPRRVGGEATVAPGFAVGQGTDRYAHLVAWRPPGKAGTSAVLVHSTHFRPRLAPLDWSSLGHPDQEGGPTGTPAVAVDAEGRAHVVVPGGEGGLRLRAQKAKGGWEPWRDLGGGRVLGDPVAVAGESGRVEVFAAVRDGVLHWRQEEPGAAPVLTEALEWPVRPGTLRALPTSAERTTLFCTDGAGDLCAWRPGGKPRALLASAGPGPVAAVRTELDGHDCTVLAQRSAAGRLVFAAYPTEEESAGAWWTESGPQIPADARVSLTTGADGRIVAALHVPSTGELYLTRRKDEPGLALEAWRPVPVRAA